MFSLVHYLIETQPDLRVKNLVKKFFGNPKIYSLI